MALKLSPEQESMLAETKRCDSSVDFKALLTVAEPEITRIVREVYEPEQAIAMTLVELRDLYLLTGAHMPTLAGVKYTAEKRAGFRDAIRLFDTAHTWFGEKIRSGDFRPRSIQEVLAASRPWRDRLAAYAGQAFAFETEALFCDINSSGTLPEEQTDLKALNGLVEVPDYQAALRDVGMTDEFIIQGQQLLAEAEGRDLIGVLGLRSQDEAMTLRNRLMTYAVLRGREARAAGINACYDDLPVKSLFDASSFRNAMRRLRDRRRPRTGQPAVTETVTEEVIETPAEPETTEVTPE
jgi:hypothetical protein